jgi:hypothetical protein
VRVDSASVSQGFLPRPLSNPRVNHPGDTHESAPFPQRNPGQILLKGRFDMWPRVGSGTRPRWQFSLKVSMFPGAPASLYSKDIGVGGIQLQALPGMQVCLKTHNGWSSLCLCNNGGPFCPQTWGTREQQLSTFRSVKDRQTV